MIPWGMTSRARFGTPAPAPASPNPFAQFFSGAAQGAQGYQAGDLSEEQLAGMNPQDAHILRSLMVERAQQQAMQQAAMGALMGIPGGPVGMAVGAGAGAAGPIAGNMATQGTPDWIKRMEPYTTRPYEAVGRAYRPVARGIGGFFKGAGKALSGLF